MSLPVVPRPAKLVLSILSSRWNLFWPGLLATLEGAFGPADHLGPALPFTETRYYDDELGTPIERRMLSFTPLVEQDRLPEVKHLTNALETTNARSDGRRLFNLDPGLLTHERLVLATGKNFTHRIYLRDGIWADLTLIFQKGRWCALPWTFPDYAGPAVQAELTRIRDLYHRAMAERD